jgi:hypothetical protein
MLKKKAVPAQPPYDRKWSAAIDHSDVVADTGCAIIISELLRVLVLIIAVPAMVDRGPYFSGKQTLSTGLGSIIR